MANGNPKRKIYLSIIIPVFNEEAKIARDVEEATVFLQRQQFDGEIIVVDDGSDDGTVEVVQGIGKSPGIPYRLIHYPRHRGKGFAVRTGVRKALGRFIMFADSGYCVSFESALTGIDMIRSGRCEIAHGSRNLSESRIWRSHVWHRRILSNIFRQTINQVLGVPYELTDTQCGFKVYRKDVAQRLYSESIIDGFLFEIELILRARRHGYRIVEFPVEWSADRDSRLFLRRNLGRMWTELNIIRKVLASQEQQPDRFANLLGCLTTFVLTLSSLNYSPLSH